MSNRNLVLAGSLWVAMVSGCAGETATAPQAAAPAPVVANLRPMTPRLGAGDPLGRQIFSESSVASAPSMVKTASADAGE